ncbi:MAG: NAD-dependent epimerase/dehydratase family protein [Nitrososphaerota archaeon]|nr:NAD-dependent epimerase/dehydratase family protein [Nitrososphaerota archaeon]
MKWSSQRVIVTGGAGFIGSNLVDSLLTKGAEVVVVDKLQLASGSLAWNRKLTRLDSIFKKHGIEKIPLEICDLETDRQKFQIIAKDCDVVFHLSALFGGRQFVDTRQAECSKMLAVDHNVIEASYEAGVERLHYASSACAYPDSLQKDPKYLLKESDILSTGEGWKSADNLYGFAKLLGEMQCLVFHQEKGMKTSACRYLTVYGPGEFDTSHAIAALIERALDRADPYVVWGSGKQERGFTFVTDIAEGSILAAEKVTDGTAINLGWDKRYNMREVAEMIFKITGLKSKMVFDKTKPEGPFSRALDISLAKKLLGWEPKVDLYEGLEKTIAWHKTLRAPQVAAGRS